MRHRESLTVPHLSEDHTKQPPRPRARIAVFGSFYRGYHVLHALLQGPIRDKVEVVGVATDDASQAFVSPGRRVWQYPHTRQERTMVQTLAQAHGLEVYTGRVKTPAFYQRMQQHWRPDLCIMATFGQKIDATLFEMPSLGFLNLHPCIDDRWPSEFVGGNPFQALLDAGKSYAVVALHHVDAGFDTGRLIAYTERIALPPGVGVVELHKQSAPQAAHLATREIEKIVDREFAGLHA